MSRQKSLQGQVFAHRRNWQLSAGKHCRDLSPVPMWSLLVVGLVWSDRGTREWEETRESEFTTEITEATCHFRM